MDMIAMARELGKAIQQDERYIRATEGANKVNSSKKLAKMVDEFNDMRNQIEFLAAQGPEANSEEVMALDEKMHALYDEINSEPVMMEYTAARMEFETFVNHIIKIITGAANGENPDEIEMDTCGGSCDHCSGCH